MRHGLGTFLLAAAAAAGSLAAPASAAIGANEGKICVSRWNATNSYFIDAVKARLRQPSSFRHIQTVVGPLTPQGFYVGKMKYSFAEGGVTRIAVATARLDRATCRATLI